MKNLFLGVLVLCGTILFSCSNVENDQSQDKKNDSTIVNHLDIIDEAIIDGNTEYKVPSPVDLYIMLFEAGAKYNEDLLCPKENIDKQFTTQEKALSFGIYASDLAYNTIFEENQKVLSYFAHTQAIAEDLALVEGFETEIAERIEKNINNNDSLYKLTRDAYWASCNFLHANDNDNLLPYIILGGWVESVYISVKSIEKYSEDQEIVERVAGQLYSLENLVSFLKTKSEDDDVLKEYIEKLAKLENAYLSLYDNDEKTVITKEQLKKIYIEIVKLRKEFIS